MIQADTPVRPPYMFPTLIKTLFIALFSTPNTPVYNLDDVNITKLANVAQHDGKAIFSYIEKPIKSNVAIFDFNTGDVHFVEDGRIAFFVPYLVPMENGFALIHVSPAFRPKVGFVDKQGAFQKLDRLYEYQGWPEGAESVFFHPRGPGLALATLKDEQQHHLAEIDLVEKTVTVLHSLPKDDYLHFWLGRGDDYYRVTSETGGIVRVPDGDFSRQMQIRPASEPRQRKATSYSGFAGNKLQQILGQPFGGDENLYMKWYDVRDDVIEIRSMVIPTNNQTLPSDKFVMGAHAGKRLVWDWRERILYLTDTEHTH